MTLDALKRALDEAVTELPAYELPELIAVLAGTQARATLRLNTPAPARPADEVVDVATLSAELHLPQTWLRAQARAGKLPHLRCGKYIKFRRAEVLAVLEADHRMAAPVRAEKGSNGAGSFPAISKSEAVGAPKTAPGAARD